MEVLVRILGWRGRRDELGRWALANSFLAEKRHKELDIALEHFILLPLPVPTRTPRLDMKGREPSNLKQVFGWLEVLEVFDGPFVLLDVFVET